MYAICCLGNPGPQYANTRHNVGFLVADYLAARHRIELRRNRFRATYGRGQIGGREVVILKPQTFMNDSGDAAWRVVQFYKIQQTDFIAVYDEMALDIGVIRLRRGGSDAGHRGMRSIADLLHTTDIARVRLGIGAAPAGWNARDWVLSPFKPVEREKVEDMVARAAEAVEWWLAEGIEAAMGKFNG